MLAVNVLPLLPVIKIKTPLYSPLAFSHNLDSCMVNSVFNSMDVGM